MDELTKDLKNFFTAEYINSIPALKIGEKFLELTKSEKISEDQKERFIEATKEDKNQDKSESS